MIPKIPERNKKAGVCYAVTDDEIELPVIDITHPAFAFEMGADELNALIEQMQRSAQIPRAALEAAAQKSILLRGIVESAGTYTSGIMTYLNKLGPDNLGDGYAGSFDRQWAGSLTPVTFRWRMRDVARLLADGLAPALAAHPAGGLHLINIGGGPAADSLNALLLLQKERPDLLAGRSIGVHVLDIDAAGPRFGARALAALLAEGAPLHGLRAFFEHIPYDWADTAPLSQLLERLGKQDAAAGSSEGGLFEFAADGQITANLRALRSGTPDDFVMVGPVVRDAGTLDPRLRSTEQVEGRPGIRYLGLETFGRLAGGAGWTIAQTLDGPMHQVVSLRKAIESGVAG